MRAVVQRVTSSSVTVDGKIVGKIGKGLTVLLGVEVGDSIHDVLYLAPKIAGLRIFSDQEDKMNLSVLDVKGEILVISQFTLLGDARKGKRPSYSNAARPEQAEALYLAFAEELEKLQIHTEKGIFGADMKVSILNDGPVTLLLDSKKIF